MIAIKMTQKAKKILGVDYGEARTGLAYSDDLGLCAIAMGNVKSYNREKAAAEIAAKASEIGAELAGECGRLFAHLFLKILADGLPFGGGDFAVFDLLEMHIHIVKYVRCLVAADAFGQLLTEEFTDCHDFGSGFGEFVVHIVHPDS